ncbi:MAG: hypothetical protein ABJN51_13305, partial [Sneathiella sp.]
VQTTLSSELSSSMETFGNLASRADGLYQNFISTSEKTSGLGTTFSDLTQRFQAYLPVAAEAVSLGSDTFSAFSKLPGSFNAVKESLGVAQGAFGGFKTALSELLPAVGPVFDKVDGFATAILPKLGGALSSAVTTVGTAFSTIGKIVLANPILAAVAAIAGAAFLIYKNWDDIVSYFTGKFDAVTKAFDEGFLQGIWALVKEFNPWIILQDAFNGIIKYIFDFDLKKFLVDKFTSAAEHIPFFGKFFKSDAAVEQQDVVKPLPAAQKPVENIVQANNSSASRKPGARIEIAFTNLPKGAEAIVTNPSNDLTVAVGSHGSRS